MFFVVPENVYSSCKIEVVCVTANEVDIVRMCSESRVLQG